MYGSELIDPITQDPYSEVSLFLARKIKQLDRSKGWSIYLQEELLEKITPEFTKKFPEYRLGAAALKKTWEKVSHFSQLFETQEDALTSDGKLNLHFLIRENLKTVLSQQKSSSFHPFLLTQQLAFKIGDSLAAFEGIKPNLEQLTEIIWTALHHLVPPSLLSKISTKKRLDVKDRLIGKWMVDILTNQPGISYVDLHQTLQDKLKLIKSLKESLVPLVYELSMDWASALLPYTTFIQTQPSGALAELRSWIYRSIHDSKDFEQQIQDIKTAALASKKNISLYDLEILSWSCLKEIHPPAAHSLFYHELAEEARSHLIHHPQEHWRSAITAAAHFLRAAHDISATAGQPEWNHRLHLWSLQGELSLRSLELPETPLTHLVRDALTKSRPLSDPAITTHLREQYLYRYRSPLIEPSRVHRMADLMRKYGWYRWASTPQDTTLDRWALLQNSDQIQTKAHKEFPVLPLCDLRKNKNRPSKINGTESH